MEIRELRAEEIKRTLFNAFERRQQVTRCWRKIEGRWVIQDIAFVDQWSEEEYEFLVQCLRRTIQTSGVVFGAFDAGRLKGFASVESERLGSAGQYLDLSSLHVSEEWRGRGMGRQLFARAAGWARARGAEKLYISAHSAVETQAFYRAVGCVEAQEYNAEHVEKEPCDCQMEYDLTK